MIDIASVPIFQQVLVVRAPPTSCPASHGSQGWYLRCSSQAGSLLGCQRTAVQSVSIPLWKFRGSPKSARSLAHLLFTAERDRIADLALSVVVGDAVCQPFL